MHQQLVYGDVPNQPLLELIGPVGGRVLDIGCGKGPLAAGLRSLGAKTLVGLDQDQRALDLASGYDELISARLEEVDWAAIGRFDLVVAADVLEHLVDPWSVLRALRMHADRLAISIPNVGHYKMVARLVRGRFTYDPEGGVMDVTHLRWFTPFELERALRQAGWRPLRWGGPMSRKRRLVRSVVGRSLDTLILHQIHVVCE